MNCCGSDSHQPLTIETWIQSQTSPRRICGRQSGTGTCFSWSSLVFSCHHHSPVLHNKLYKCKVSHATYWHSKIYHSVSVAALPCFVLGRTYKACIPPSTSHYGVALVRTMTIMPIDVPFLCIIFTNTHVLRVLTLYLWDTCIITLQRQAQQDGL